MKAKIKNRFHQLEVAMRQNQTDINNLARLMEMNRQAIINLENESEQPKLKTLDQSVFDGLDEKWQFAAVDKNGEANLYTHRMTTDGTEFTFCKFFDFNYELIGTGYDTTNWQDSLIERENKELTGSDLCRYLKSRKHWVLAVVSNENDATAEFHQRAVIVTGIASDGGFICGDKVWQYAVPIDHKGEPLSQAEVGL